MKKKTNVLLILASLAVVSSCKDEEILLKQSQSNEISTRAVICTPDVLSDEYKSRIQSDKESMLIDQIVFRDSMYILNLSTEEAKDLCIPDSLYTFYLQLINDINNNE